MSMWRRINRKREKYAIQFQGGINNYATEDMINDREAVELKNAASYFPPSIESALKSKDITSAINGAGGDTFPDKMLFGQPNLRKDEVFHFIYADMDEVHMKWGYIEDDVGTIKFYEIADLTDLGFLTAIVVNDYLTTEYKGITYAAVEDKLLKWTGPTGGGVGTVTSVGTLPAEWLEMNKVIMHETKLYAVSTAGNRLFFSKSGDPEDFTAAGDAGWIDVNNKRSLPITDIAIVAGRIAIFTASSIHLLYGETAGGFSLNQISDEIGCIPGTLLEMDDNRVYFVSSDGAYRWDGYSLPQKISQKIDEIFIKGELDSAYGLSNNKAYRYKRMYCVSSENSPILFMFNIDTNSWFTKYEPSVIEYGMAGYVELNKKGFALARGSAFDEVVVLELDSVKYSSTIVPDTGITQKESIDEVEWEYTTKRFNFDLISGKTDLLEIVVEIDYRGTFKLEMITEDHGTVELISMDEQEVVYRTPSLILLNYPEISRAELRTMISPEYHNVNSFKIKLSGKGYVKIYGLQLRVRTYDV